jgi:hypothetical protein
MYESYAPIVAQLRGLTLFPIVLNVLFVRDLQNRLIQPLITVDTVNPGFCVSQLRSEWSGNGIQAMMGRLVEKVMAHTSEEGSRQLVYGAVGGTEAQMKGSYVSSSKVAEPSDFVISTEGVELQNKIYVCALFFAYLRCLQDLNFRPSYWNFYRWLAQARRF